MARELHFYHEFRCYVVHWTADLSKEAIAAHWRDLLEQPDYRPDHSALHDLRRCEITSGYAETLESRELYQREVAPKVGRSRVAILVDNAVAFGTGRQITMMTGLEDDSLVTYSVEDAKKWVGLGPDFALPYEAQARA